MYRVLTFLTTLFIASSAAAAVAPGATGPGNDLFTDNPTDMAHRLLAMIFGNVPGVLQGGTSLIGDVSMLINWGCLVIASAIVGFSIIRAIYDTAHHGEVMGKNISSTWYPIRASIGISSMLPIAGGYSLLQVAIIWCVLQGSNLANIVWEGTVSAIGSGHMVTVPKDIDGTAIMYSALRSEVCALALNKQAAVGMGGSGNLVTRVHINTPEFKGWRWDSAEFGPSVCGQIKWPTPAGITSGGSVLTSAGAVSVVSPAAGMASAIISANNMANIDIALRNTHISATDAVISKAAEAAPYIVSGVPADVQIGRQIVDQGITAYNNAIRAAGAAAVVNNMGVMGSGGNALTEQVDAITRDGWATAGLWYFRIAALNDRFQSSIKAVPVTESVKPDNTLPTIMQDYLQNYLAVVDGFADRRNQETGLAKQGAWSGHEMPGDNPLLSMLTSLCSAPFHLITEAIVENDQGMNPIVALRNKGHIMLDAAYMFGGAIIFKDTLIGALNKTGITSLIPGKQEAAGGADGANQSLPVKMMVSFIFIMLVGTGITLAYIIPMMVPMIWIMGVFTFLVICVEAVLAAPVWMLGAANADSGHEVLGQTTPGFGIMLSLMMRPVMAVAGLVAAMMVMGAIMFLVNESIGMLISGNDAGNVSGILGMLAYLGLFTYGIRLLALHSFKLIHELPDRATRYIGSMENTGDHGKADEIVGGTEKDKEHQVGELQRQSQMHGANPGGNGGKLDAGAAAAAQAELDTGSTAPNVQSSVD